MVVVGAGLGGAFLAAELAQRHIPSIVVDAATTVASGASGNPAGIVKPYVTREPTQVNHYYSDAFNSLLHWLNKSTLAQAAEFHPVGALQLIQNAYPPNAAYARLSHTDIKKRYGVELNSPALLFEQGGWLNPSALCKTLLQHELIELQLGRRVQVVNRLKNRWQLVCGEDSITCAHLVLATGAELHQTPFTALVPVIPARGQLSVFKLEQTLSLSLPVITGKHYLINLGHSIVTGATFKRASTDAAVTENDHQANLQGVMTLVPDIQINATTPLGYAGVRATTPDRMPVVGPTPRLDEYAAYYPDLHHGKPPDRYPKAPYYSGLYLLGGFGSRGLVHAPECARRLANYLTGKAESIPTVLHPARFSIAKLKRGRQPL